jgi:hypothetical protein
MRNNLAEIRKQAEQAVLGMAEGELKVKAFETILAHLLSARVGNIEARTESEPRSPEKKSTAVREKPPTSATERILSLKADGFFGAQKSIDEIRQELKRNAWHYPVTALSGPLQALVAKRQLRRERVGDEDGRKGWKYSNR